MNSGSQFVPPAGGALIVNGRNEMVIVNQCGTSWSLPKGGLERGESVLEAARREAREETGLDELSLLGELGSYSRSSVDELGRIDDSRWKHITVLLFSAPARPLLPEDPDNPEARWVTVEDALTLLTHPADCEFVEQNQYRIRTAMTGARISSDEISASALRGHYPAIPDTIIDEFIELSHASSEEIQRRAVRTLDKPYGLNRILRESGTWGLSSARLLPGKSSSFHMHNTRREFFRVRTGYLTLVTVGAVATISPLESGSSTPSVPHAVANQHDETLELIEIFSPADLNDKIRISDKYGRPLGQVSFDE